MSSCLSTNYIQVEDAVPPAGESASSSSLSVTHEIVVPDDDTTYWCSTHRLPGRVRRRKHHVTQVRSTLGTGATIRVEPEVTFLFFNGGSTTSPRYATLGMGATKGRSRILITLGLDYRISILLQRTSLV